MAVVPVFVSSTFRDFHGERDVIRSVVAPALDALVAPLGARVELLDLRWGVDTSTAEDEQRTALGLIHIVERAVEQQRCDDIPVFIAGCGNVHLHGVALGMDVQAFLTGKLYLDRQTGSP